ncbi:MAG TPA: nuclear transport factor 2 family protein [Burkholderiaceae bacterium]|jgi:ketosteroid isomerase-like protein|nr:nuclear transport factor 2 family protein [Burkholderiaceae bacterium]
MAMESNSERSPLTSTAVDRWLGFYGDAWVKRDPARAAALFAADAAYFETPFDAPFCGRDTIYAYWEAVPRSQENISFRSRAIAVTAETAIAHLEAAFTRIPGGQRVELDGVFFLAFDRAGLCTTLREWWHRRET